MIYVEVVCLEFRAVKIRSEHEVDGLVYTISGTLLRLTARPAVHLDGHQLILYLSLD